MAITPTQFAKKTTQCETFVDSRVVRVLTAWAAASWSDAKRRVISSYREWIRGVRPRWDPFP